ncbi:hypothetical protein PtA15_16A305 [Puccinia triticina]|uniref:Uncharacterized protein n=1 Tax=Puccinia triticina TaxID=208348 RepID=A0ABY7DBR9_9BASI|nr:uncharacterized protein PtA15_16A305 [Puccinia triticina]WAQ92397.1 hypothetical protein PtA15_16A305 [Puccinia triticina]WAR64135.1 hypothetical protein PtB15_16B295 [Puccinia triticina]
MDLSNPLRRRERGQTFADNDNAEHQSLMQTLARLANAFDTVRNVSANEVQGNGSAPAAPAPIDPALVRTSEAASSALRTPPRTPNRTNHTRKHTMVEGFAIQAPLNVKERPQEAQGGQGQVQISGSQQRTPPGHRSPPGASESETFVHPSTPASKSRFY